MSIGAGLPVELARGYDLPCLSAGLRELGYDLAYSPETSSTMDDAKQFGTRKTVVLADHQTAGRGRYNRSWLDISGESILTTFVEDWGLAGDPPPQSLLPQQLFVMAGCQAARELTGSPEVAIRWPNDLTARTKKLGGILIENTPNTRGIRHPKLFGIGINVHEAGEVAFPGTDYGAISLDEVAESDTSRQELLLALVQKWSGMRVDLRTMNSPRTFDYYQNLWRKSSSLIGQAVTIAGIGLSRDRTVEGEVLDTPLGGGIILGTAKGAEEIIEFHSETIVKVES